MRSPSVRLGRAISGRRGRRAAAESAISLQGELPKSGTPRCGHSLRGRCGCGSRLCELDEVHGAECAMKRDRGSNSRQHLLIFCQILLCRDRERCRPGRRRPHHGLAMDRGGRHPSGGGTVGGGLESVIGQRTAVPGRDVLQACRCDHRPSTRYQSRTVGSIPPPSRETLNCGCRRVGPAGNRPAVRIRARSHEAEHCRDEAGGRSVRGCLGELSGEHEDVQEEAFRVFLDRRFENKDTVKQYMTDLGTAERRMDSDIDEYLAEDVERPLPGRCKPADRTVVNGYREFLRSVGTEDAK